MVTTLALWKQNKNQYPTMTEDNLGTTQLHREIAPVGDSHSVQWVDRCVKAARGAEWQQTQNNTFQN